METSCQLSYPLNSENASPPGTLTVYLSGADRAVAPNTASAPSTAVVAPIIDTYFRFIAAPLVVAPCPERAIAPQDSASRFAHRKWGLRALMAPTAVKRLRQLG